MIIRGMALGEVRPKDIFRVLGKEVQVGLICGALLAALNFCKQTIFSPSTDIMVDLTVSVSMGLVVVVAKAMGCMLPILAKVCRLDPAIMAGPLVYHSGRRCGIVDILPCGTMARTCIKKKYHKSL